jgi:hypothetical protein
MVFLMRIMGLSVLIFLSTSVYALVPGLVTPHITSSQNQTLNRSHIPFNIHQPLQQRTQISQAFGRVQQPVTAPGASSAESLLSNDIQRPYPRLLVSDADKAKIVERIEEMAWAASIHKGMTESVTPYVERHQTDPEWILSRYQMNWDTGAHYTRHISDPSGTRLLEWSGNAPYPTVRVTTHKRPPVASDGYRYRLPSLEDIKPYDTDSLWYMQSSGPSGEWGLAEPRLFTGSVNSRINDLAVQSAILYWLTGDEHFARFSSDILFQWARGAYYQDPVEGTGRNGLFCIQSLGDRNYDDLVIAFDFVRHYMEQTGYETRFFQPVFEKLAKTTKLRGFISNNWYAAQTTTLTYNALSLDDPVLRDYYLSFYLERDTVHGSWGQLALPTTMQKHFTHDGHWKENAGYHDMPVGDLLMAAVPVENNGYRVFEDHPALYQASYAMLRYSFPNLQLMGYGDIGGLRNQSPRNLEVAIRYAAEYAPDILSGLVVSLNRLIDAGLYDRSSSGWYGLLTYLADLPEVENERFEWDRTFELDFARLFGQRNGTDMETGLMYYVQGASYNHNHANGMAMELYGRGYILGADPGIASTYEDSVFVHYLATFAAHNTVIAAGASQPSAPFTGGGGSKQMGQINLSVMEPAAGGNGVSPHVSFTETDYTEPSTDTHQKRLMGIIRTSPDTGYYVDVYRSDNYISNDYLYHNIGHGVTLYDRNREALEMRPDVIPYRPDRQSGMGWFQDIRTPAASVMNSIAVFRVQEQGSDDVFMQMFMPLVAADKLFTATGPRTRTAPSPINHLTTPKTIIHRPQKAWDEPFAVIYEPYRGADGYSVRSVQRIPTGSSFAALDVENRDGSRQFILQSDQPETKREAGQCHLTGHFGVVSLNADDSLKYLYMGHGTGVGWNGYQIMSYDGETAASVEFQGDVLIVSSNGEIEVRLPYHIAGMRDQHENKLQVIVETALTVSDAERGANPVFSTVTIPAGVANTLTLERMK